MVRIQGFLPSGVVRVHSTEYFTPNGDLVVCAITFLTGCASSVASKAATLSWMKPQAGEKPSSVRKKSHRRPRLQYAVFVFATRPQHKAHLPPLPDFFRSLLAFGVIG